MAPGFFAVNGARPTPSVPTLDPEDNVPAAKYSHLITTDHRSRLAGTQSTQPGVLLPATPAIAC
ncbi:hypothetical protein CGRA01v4_10124 [Colletotrichum graminicola]|nr:hypothetical protein CGRA01v4_10124 [Colletotrichum graminicola]